jgi:hypothetical protein
MARVAKLIGLIVSGIGLVVWSESPVTLAEQSSLVTPTALKQSRAFMISCSSTRGHIWKLRMNRSARP